MFIIINIEQDKQFQQQMSWIGFKYIFDPFLLGV